MTSSIQRIFSLVAVALIANVLSPLGAFAQTTYYWDTNGATAGFGNADGTWGTSAFWSTAIAGNATTSNSTTTTSDDINFGTATNGYPTFDATRTVTISGNQSVGSITYGAASARSAGNIGVLITGGTALHFGGNATITNNAASTFEIASTITGSSGLNIFTNTVNGIVQFSGANSYTGVTTLNAAAATFRVNVLANGGSNSGIGASSSSASNLVFNSGVLQYEGGTVSTNRNFTINGSADIRNSGAGVLTWSGSPSYGTANVTASLTLRGTSAGANVNVFSGLLADNGTGQVSFRKDQSNTWSLNAANTFSGSSRITGGILVLGNASALQTSYFNTAGSVAGNATAGLRTTGAALNLGGLSGDKNLSAIYTSSTGGYSSVTGITLNVVAANNLSYSGVIDGSRSLTKSGAGTQAFSGNHTYTGTTTISGGTLLVNGNNASAIGNVTVASTATLGGNGTLGGDTTIQSGGTLSPGNSPGTLNYSNADLIFNDGGNFNWQIFDANGVAGTGYDTNSVTGNGTLDLSALTGATDFNINLWSLSSVGPDVNGNATNFTSTNNYTWTLVSTPSAILNFDASEFTINTSAINGTSGFSNTTSGTFSVALADSNTDLVLVYTAVPEPGTMALIAGAMVGLVALRRRWKS